MDWMKNVAASLERLTVTSLQHYQPMCYVCRQEACEYAEVYSRALPLYSRVLISQRIRIYTLKFSYFSSKQKICLQFKISWDDIQSF